ARRRQPPPEPPVGVARVLRVAPLLPRGRAAARAGRRPRGLAPAVTRAARASSGSSHDGGMTSPETRTTVPHPTTTDAPPRWTRYVACGDSFTEGLWDTPDGRPDDTAPLRGWADQLASHLSARRTAAGLP